MTSQPQDNNTLMLSFHFVRGVVSVFAVWLEQFPADFDDAPRFTCLNKMLSFVTSEMKANHSDELARKIRHRLDKFQITPFEDEGKALQTLFFTCFRVSVYL